MKLEVEQIDMENEEEVIVRCHDVGADWVGNVKDAAHLRRQERESTGEVLRWLPRWLEFSLKVREWKK